ncbi:hypothetical protein L211DRAFT_516233 [Terfezia boudieri ATCC MYA-4762]|uniref:Uncharacterized protein n=1 Tax=Terfezia boudieri ATCC MYA-4762 TaxID=1051890 RepID=A0A3N4LCB9_9PEZI|nr:hypothetical protein L211DRAFT_516233 [Terfezia boudieri ATCC MYA-4762]
MAPLPRCWLIPSLCARPLPNYFHIRALHVQDSFPCQLKTASWACSRKCIISLLTWSGSFLRVPCVTSCARARAGGNG